MTTTTQEDIEHGITNAQERYQSAIDFHEHINPHHLTHSIELLCEHELFSMGCYGDGHELCTFQTTLVSINDTYEAQIRSTGR
jgi:hypothetical protein